jgi:Fe-S oxidoreductase
MLVDDLPDLVEADPRARWVAEAAVGFERALADLGGVPDGGGEDVVVHPHCHARALGEAGPAIAVAGPEATDSGAGCCGMAGAFGYRHPRLSRDIAELGVAPAARAARTMVAAGTSCRQQIRDTTGREALHPAELLAARLDPAAR